LSTKPAFPLTRLGLLLLCAAWLLPGLVGHAPWKGGDGEHFVALWLWQQQGMPLQAELPPLYYWTATATAWLASPFLPLPDGARLASGIFVALALWFTARAAQALYGAEHRWAAVLVLLGCVGLLVRAHELNAHTAQFAAAAIALDGLARLPQGRRGGIQLALGMALLLLAGATAEALLLGLLAMGLARLPAYRSPMARGALAWGSAGTLTFAAGWLAFLAVRQIPWAPTLGLDRFLAFADLRPTYYFGILGWFAWPAWPLAAWAAYHGRRHWRTPALALPALVLAGLLLLYVLVARPSEAHGLLLLLPLALLGAWGLSSLRRGAANAMLWFSVMLFACIALLLWVYWSAHDLGTPARLAQRITKLGMTGVGELRPGALALGALVTLAWIGFLVNVKRSPLRPVLVWTGGLTFIWVLLLTLFQAPLDHRLSYASVAEALVARVPHGECVQTHQIRHEQRLLLIWHSGLSLVPADLDCRWLLVETRIRGAEPYVPDVWIKQWDGARPGDRSDRFHLYVRR
jgi:hypothetical protein